MFLGKFNLEITNENLLCWWLFNHEWKIECCFDVHVGAVQLKKKKGKTTNALLILWMK